MRRRGVTYIAVMGTAVLVSLLTVTGLSVARLKNRAFRSANEAYEARRYAQAGLQMGLLKIKQDSNWRTLVPNGNWAVNREIGVGTVTLTGIDPVDNNIANSQLNPLVLTASGQKGSATQKLKITLVPNMVPLAALNTALHATGIVTIDNSDSADPDNGPISTNGQIDNNGAIYGDAHCQSFLNAGSVYGQRVTGAPAKPMPDSTVIPAYIAMATSISNPGVIEHLTLAPGRNPISGSLNSDGVYYINASSGDLTIRNCRINGTLIVRLGVGRKLKIDNAVLMHNYRPDFPVLIVDGDQGLVEISLGSTLFGLSELLNFTNFNPSGAPYNGYTDGLTDDFYPNEIQGLVHSRSPITFKNSPRIKGVVLCESSVSFESSCSLIQNSAIYRNPPYLYWTIDGMKALPGEIRQLVD
jgi:hypothetical protein